MAASWHLLRQASASEDLLTSSYSTVLIVYTHTHTHPPALAELLHVDVHRVTFHHALKKPNVSYDTHSHTLSVSPSGQHHLHSTRTQLSRRTEETESTVPSLNIIMVTRSVVWYLERIRPNSMVRNGTRNFQFGYNGNHSTGSPSLMLAQMNVSLS